jgi:hypothetical protein
MPAARRSEPFRAHLTFGRGCACPGVLIADQTASPTKSRTVVYRQTELGSAQLLWLQSLVDIHPGLSFRDLAAHACGRFEWRRPNGELAIDSCSVFLRRLQEWGLLQVRRTRRPFGRRRQRDDYADILRFLGPIPGMVECPPEGSLTVRPIAKEEWAGFQLHMDRYHYLGFAKPSGESLCYAALLGEELVALLVWGAAVPYNAPRDRYIGWDSATRVRKLLWVINNRRFLILPWIRGVPSLASRVLGANLRRLSRDWQEVYGHELLLAETFVDARFAGTCYRASNWLYLGHTRGFSRAKGLRLSFVPNHAPKAVFVYPLHRRACRLLRERKPA